MKTIDYEVVGCLTAKETIVFFHGWPDSGNLWTESASAAYLGKNYRCVLLTMPWYGGVARALERNDDRWGYSFETMADMIAATIHEISPDKPVIAIAHDWGVHWCLGAQNRYPHLFSKVVLMDIGLPHFGPPKLCPTALYMMVFFVAYQGWIILAFLCSTFIPFFGDVIGRWLIRFALCIVNNTPEYAIANDESITGKMGYPYLRLHCDYWLRVLGLKKPFDSSFQRLSSTNPQPSCPVFFVYNSKSMILLHPANWRRHLESRAECQVMAVPSGHWIMKSPLKSQVFSSIDTWLDNTKTKNT